MDQQHCTNWPVLLRPLLKKCHPLHAEISRPIERDYYWAAAETEYATDVMFRDRAALARIYPALVHHAVMTFGSEQVLRFMHRSAQVGLQEVQRDRRRLTAYGSNTGSIRTRLNAMTRAASCALRQRSMNREIFAAFARPRKVLAALSAGANCAAVYLTFTNALK